MNVDAMEVIKERSGPERIRIMFLVDDLVAGGTQRWLTLLLKGLKERGYDQRVLVMKNVFHPDFMRDVAQWAKVYVIGEPALWLVHGFVRVYAGMKSWRPHIVQTALPTADIVGRVIGRLAKVPVIVSSIRGRNTDKSPWLRFLARRTAGLPDKVIFNAEDTIPFVSAREGVARDQAIYIPNGIEAPTSAKSSASVRRELGIPETARIVGAVGRLHPSKGHGDLITAFSLLAREVPDAVLVIVGDGELRTALETQVRELHLRDRVFLPGYRPDIAEWLGTMEVFAHPSLWEGMPNAVMEAMVVGKPVVACSVDGINALIIDGETGLLVEPSSPDKLAEQLRRLLEDRELAARLGANAARRMKERYGLDRMVAEYDGVYRRLLGAAIVWKGKI